MTIDNIMVGQKERICKMWHQQTKFINLKQIKQLINYNCNKHTTTV